MNSGKHNKWNHFSLAIRNNNLLFFNNYPDNILQTPFFCIAALLKVCSVDC